MKERSKLHVGRPRRLRNDIAVSDSQCLNITCAYRAAQNKPAWRETRLVPHSVTVIIIGIIFIYIIFYFLFLFLFLLLELLLVL